MLVGMDECNISRSINSLLLYTTIFRFLEVCGHRIWITSQSNLVIQVFWGESCPALLYLAPSSCIAFMCILPIVSTAQFLNLSISPFKTLVDSPDWYHPPSSHHLLPRCYFYLSFLDLKSTEWSHMCQGVRLHPWLNRSAVRGAWAAASFPTAKYKM